MLTSTALLTAINEAVSVLRTKGVVAFPTDTLYGLGANIFCDEAVNRVFQIKGRPHQVSLPVLIGNVHDLKRVTTDIPDVAWTMAERFWPGPLTLVLRKSPAVSYVVTGGKDSVAVRTPRHEVPLALIEALGSPITGTSANPTGGPDPVTADDVRRLLGEPVPYIVDGGPATVGTPSTIVDLTGPKPRLVRRGAIPDHVLQSVCTTSLETE